MSKNEVSRWESVAQYVATFPDGDDDGACDVEVQIGEHDGKWYVRTQDDAGGEDDAPYYSFHCRGSAESFAEDFAASQDEGDGEQDAEGYLEDKLRDAAGEPDDEGAWCVYWESACTEDEHVVERYADQGSAEAAAALANKQLIRKHLGGNLLCAFVVRELVDGEWVMP